MADRSCLSFLQAVSSPVIWVVAILVAETNGQCNGTTMSLIATYNTNSLPLPSYLGPYPSSYPRLDRLCGNIGYRTYNSTGLSLFLSFSASDTQYNFSIEYSAQPATTATTDLPWWRTTTTTIVCIASEYFPRLAHLCGNLYSRTFYSSSSTAFVSLTTDGSVQDSGFNISYSAVLSAVTPPTMLLPWWTTMPSTTAGESTSSTCIKGSIGGVTLRAEYLNAKYIEWKNYPYYNYYYPNNADCAWILLAELDYVIHIRVIKMDLEYDVVCAYDAVTMYDASRDLNSSKIAKLCSNAASINDYNSSGSNMYITYTSNSTTVGTGFRLMYEAVRASNSPASSTSSYSSVNVGVIVGGVVGVIVIVVLGALVIMYSCKRRQACRRQAARRPRAPLTEQVQAPPAYTTVSSQLVCGGIVLEPRNRQPAVGGRPHYGYSSPGYAADTEGYEPPHAYAELLVLGHILPAVYRNNDSSDSVPAVPSAFLNTSRAEARGAAGGSDTVAVTPVGIDFKRLPLPSPPPYDDVMRVTGASPPSSPLPPLPLTASTISV